MKGPKPRKWLTLGVVARELGIGHETARQMVVTGELEACRPTGNPRGWWGVAPAELARKKAAIAAQSA